MINSETSTLGEALKYYRNKAGCTVQALADEASVPPTLISGLQTGARHCGENNGRRIAKALGLTDEELEQFVYMALNSSSHRILKENGKYPAEILNLAAASLRDAGIEPDQVEYSSLDGKSAEVYLKNGGRARIEVRVFMN